MRLRAESKGASSAHFMKRRFHCKKVEELKRYGIVILSEAKESKIRVMLDPLNNRSRDSFRFA